MTSVPCNRILVAGVLVARFFRKESARSVSANLATSCRLGHRQRFSFGSRNRESSGLASSHCSLGDFVLSSLCHEAPSVDITTAMTYELLKVSTLQWHPEVIERLGLTAVRWPTLRKQGEPVGSMKIGRAAIPCFAAVGDYHCALLGALLFPDELSLNISTGSQVSRIVPCSCQATTQTRPSLTGSLPIPSPAARGPLVKRSGRPAHRDREGTGREPG